MAIEYRYALGRQERFPELVGELVGLPVDLLVVGSSPAAVAAKQATRTIPIVFLGGGDPVRSGLVASLARPGGNVTGLTNMAWETAGKRLALFKESVPTLVRVAALYDAANPENLRHVQEVQAAGRALGVTVQLCGVSANPLHGFGRVMLQNLGRAVPNMAVASMTPGGIPPAHLTPSSARGLPRAMRPACSTDTIRPDLGYDAAICSSQQPNGKCDRQFGGRGPPLHGGGHA